MTIIRIEEVINNLDRLLVSNNLYTNKEICRAGQARYIINDVERAFLPLMRPHSSRFRI